MNKTFRRPKIVWYLDPLKCSSVNRANFTIFRKKLNLEENILINEQSKAL